MFSLSGLSLPPPFIQQGAAAMAGSALPPTSDIEPDARAKKRILRDIEILRNEPVEGIMVHHDESDLTLAHAIIEGPKGTPYEGGFFYFVIRYPHNYPIKNPAVRLMTTGNGQVRFNPNLYNNGKVCLSILGTWSGPGWTASYDTKAILISIQSLMCDEPYYNEPGTAKSTSSKGSSEIYNRDVLFNTINVAALDMVLKNNTNDVISFPDELYRYVKQRFSQNVTFYENTISAKATTSEAVPSSSLVPFMFPYSSSHWTSDGWNWTKIPEKLTKVKAMLKKEGYLAAPKRSLESPGPPQPSAKRPARTLSQPPKDSKDIEVIDLE